MSYCCICDSRRMIVTARQHKPQQYPCQSPFLLPWHLPRTALHIAMLFTSAPRMGQPQSAIVPAGRCFFSLFALLALYSPPFSISPFLPFSLSPFLPFSLSPFLPLLFFHFVPAFPLTNRRPADPFSAPTAAFSSVSCFAILLLSGDAKPQCTTAAHHTPSPLLCPANRTPPSQEGYAGPQGGATRSNHVAHPALCRMTRQPSRVVRAPFKGQGNHGHALSIPGAMPRANVRQVSYEQRPLVHASLFAARR